MSNIIQDIFKHDPQFLENEEKYNAIKVEILGEDSDEESGSEGDTSDEESDEEGALFVTLFFHVSLTLTSR